MVEVVRMIGLAQHRLTGINAGYVTGERRRAYLLDLGIGLAFLAAAAAIGHELWPDPATRVLALIRKTRP